MKKYQLEGFVITEYKELSSTNTVASAYRENDFTDKSVVLTYNQTGGRGQGCNKWESEEGKNLSLSILFKPPKLEASRQFIVSIVIALACKDLLEKYLKNVQVKWPNDIYVGDRKIGGILIEHRISGNMIASSVCGIGLNINQEEFLSGAPNPVSLYQLTGKRYELTEILKELLICINSRYAQLHSEGVLEQDYLSSLYRKQGIYTWKDECGFFKASVEGIDEFGRLVLMDENGKERIYGFKEVEFI